MKVTVQLSKLFNYPVEAISIEVDKYRDVFSAVYNLLGSSEDIVALIDNGNIVWPELLDFAPKSNILYLTPTIGGSFDSLGNMSIFYGSSTALSTQELALTGLNKRILESSLYGQAQTAFDTVQRANDRAKGIVENTDDPTTGFGSLTLTSLAGKQVPLHFGLVKTSGAVINQVIKHIQRGGVDSVRVIDYV